MASWGQRGGAQNLLRAAKNLLGRRASGQSTSLAAGTVHLPKYGANASCSSGESWSKSMRWFLSAARS
jgi:hypothetical protein